MALINCDFFSYELGMNTQVQVILPEIRHAKRTMEDRKYKVVYCLHGHAQDHTSWNRLGNVETLLANANVIAVFPNGLRSFYTDAKNGYRYESFLTKELPVIVHNYFPASSLREDTYIMGYSMGGYGALKAAFSCPEQYAGVAAFSVAADPFETIQEIIDKNFATAPDLMQNIQNIFGSHAEFLTSNNNLHQLMRYAVSQHSTLPGVYHACGKSDFLLSKNRALSHTLSDILPTSQYQYEEWSGDHDWFFWGKALENALHFFNLIS